MKLFRQAAEIGKARRKADHIDAVIRRTMRGDEVCDAHLLHLGHLGEIKPDVAAVNHRHDKPRPRRPSMAMPESRSSRSAERSRPRMISGS